MKLTKKTILGTALTSVLTMLGATPAFADAVIGPQLSEQLAGLDAAETVQVIVSYEGDDPVTADEAAVLDAVGVTGFTFQALPMAGVTASATQIGQIAELEGVRSIYLNTPVEFHNGEARQLTGVDRMRTDGNLRNSIGIPYSGKGVGVVVNDSGIDATHPDLAFGEKTVQNVMGTTNLNAYDALLPVTYVEDIPDTDIGSGHGTHVAGTVGGLGTQSGGEHAGVAPGADLIGYGSGAVVFVLDTLGGLDYALVNQFRYNIRVVNNSWGQSGTTAPFDPDNPTSIATKMMADRGIINVFAAGNEGSGEGTIGGTFIKAPWVVTVGAGNKDGTLADFSSRGVKDGGGSVEVDGVTYDWTDRPNVVAPGVDIVSTLANTGSLGYLDIRDADYAGMQGTSMAAPHTAGVIALMLEANPQLSWPQIIEILEDTATNMPGMEPWEVGAGYINAYAAVTTAAGVRGDFGDLQSLNRDFNADLQQTRIEGPDETVTFNPVGENDVREFTVAPGLSTVIAKAVVSDNTVAIVLRDPEGNRYGSSISLPILGENIAVTAPAVPGTWTVEVRGIGSISGVALDPLGLTNGTAVPLLPVDVDIEFNRIDGFTGLNDIEGHPAQGFIERGVAERLLDSRSGGFFDPDTDLTRGELADYLSLGGAVRQFRNTDGSSVFSDTAAGVENAAAEAATARGAALRNLAQDQAGVMTADGGGFDPLGTVSRAEMAYTLVQALGMEAEAEAARAALESQAITVGYNDERVALDDDADIPANLRGYVQLALDLQLMRAGFSLEQGPFDLEPTIHATFSPADNVDRGSFAFNAVNLFDRYSQAAE